MRFGLIRLEISAQALGQRQFFNNGFRCHQDRRHFQCSSTIRSTSKKCNMFINITVPSDTQKGDLRRAIRSQAALSSADSRKNTIAARATANSTSPEEQKSLRVRVRRKSKVNAIKDDPEAPRSSSVSIASTQGSPCSSSYSPLQSNYIFTSQSDQWNRSNPCLAYPCVDEWHPAIPQLVDTCSSHGSILLRSWLITL